MPRCRSLARTRVFRAVELELIADRGDRLDDRGVVMRGGRLVVEGGAGNSHQPASFCDAEARGPTMTDVFALFGRGALFTAPLETPAPAPACRQAARAPQSGLHITGAGRRRPHLHQSHRLLLLHQDPDQGCGRHRGAWRAHAGSRRQELSDLALELDAMGAVLGHGLSSFESPARWSILAGPTVRPRGPTPNGVPIP